MSAYFSTEEFEQMKRELQETGDSMMMYTIAKKTLFGKIRKDCMAVPYLDPVDHAEDVMQNINCKLMTGCVLEFLNSTEFPPTAEGFKSWLFRVERNAFVDFLRSQKRNVADEIPEIYAPEGEPDQVEAAERINRAFRTVLSSKNSIHIVLSWLAQNLLIARYNIDRCQSADMVDENFRGMSLDTMLNVLVLASEDILWLNLDRELIEEQRQKLNRHLEDGRRLGDLQYGEFYDEKSAISKWCYRMNKQIRTEEETKNGTSDN